MLLNCPHCRRQVDCTGVSGTVACPYCSQQFIARPQTALPESYTVQNSTGSIGTSNPAFAERPAETAHGTAPGRILAASGSIYVVLLFVSLALSIGWIVENHRAGLSIYGGPLAERQMLEQRWIERHEAIADKLMLGLMAVNVGASVALLVFLYVCWRAIQDGKSRVTPGQAVGLLFVPFYNLYWIFVAVGSLGSEMHAYVVRNRIAAQRVSRNLGFGVCLLMLCNLVPVLGLVSQLFYPFVMLVYIRSLTRTAGGVLRAGNRR